MPPPMTTASAASGSCGLVSMWVSGAGMARRQSSDEILIAVIGADDRQEPWLSEVTRDGRPVEVAPRIEMRFALEHLGHDRAHVRGHVRAVAAVAHRVEDAV